MAQGIIIDRTQRPALTGTTLIKQNNAKFLRIKKTPQRWGATATRPTMQHDYRAALWIAAFLHIQLMPLAYGKIKLPVSIQIRE